MGACSASLIIAVAVIAFLAISFGVARWLNNDTVERARVVELLRAQAQRRRGRDAAPARRLLGSGLPRHPARERHGACVAAAS